MFSSIYNLAVLINMFLMPQIIFLKLCNCQLVYQSTPESLFLNNNMTEWIHTEFEAVESEISNYAVGPTSVKVVLLLDKTMAILNYDESGKILEKCTLYDLEKTNDRAASAQATIGMPIVKTDLKTMQSAINKCRQISASQIIANADHSNSYNSTLAINNLTEEQESVTSKPDNSNSLWKGLIPGTKWCGLGDAAHSYDDLGPRRDIDLCCRAHDHCPVRLKAFRYEYGLINLSLYTKSHCDCDQDFLKCLKAANNSVATMLGNIYFNVLKVQCIKEEKPLVCIEVRKNKNGYEECLRYQVSQQIKMKFVSPPEFVI